MACLSALFVYPVPLQLCDFSTSVTVQPDSISSPLFEQCGTEDHLCPEMLTFTCSYKGARKYYVDDLTDTRAQKREHRVSSA
jgi:hypothetical protein